MDYKIIVDAGHGGETDPGAVYQERQEKNDNLRLAKAVGEILQKNGINVVYTRTSDIYQTPFEKAKIANESEGDIFISFHRNSSPMANQYNGAQVLVYKNNGIAGEMAENILGALGEIGFKELGVEERPGLVVLRKTKMPAILVETGFINSDKDNQIFDENFEEIAQGIAEAILGTLDEQKAMEPTYYRVQVGAFGDRERADQLLYQLLDQGYPAFLLYQDDLYKVQIGAFHEIGNAIRMEQRLRRAGYATFITT